MAQSHGTNLKKTRGTKTWKGHRTNLKKTHGTKTKNSHVKFDKLTAQKLGIATAQIRRNLTAQKLEKAAAQN